MCPAPKQITPILYFPTGKRKSLFFSWSPNAVPFKPFISMEICKIYWLLSHLLLTQLLTGQRNSDKYTHKSGDKAGLDSV